jgi:hypothetical protein
VASALEADIHIPMGQLSMKSLARYFRQLLDFPIRTSPEKSRATAIS